MSNYKITSIPGKDISHLIAEAELDYVNKGVVPENFPIKTNVKKTLDVHLLEFKKALETKNAISKMDKESFRPASIEELVTFSSSYPDVQREFPIVGLGTIWKGDIDRVPVIWGGSKGRSLFLLWSNYNWAPGFRFAAVKK